MSVRKRRLDEGGLEVEAELAGPALFLDIWAVRELSHDGNADLRQRLVSAVRTQRGSLLTSSSWFTELDTLRGAARDRAATFFSALGANWLPINPVVSMVAKREMVDELGAHLSMEVLSGFALDRCGELLRTDTDPHSLTDDEFFDLGRALAWTGAGPTDEPDARLRALKAEAKARADPDAEEQRRDRSSCDRLYPELPATSGRMLRVHNAVWREATRRAPGRVWVENDGFDIVHLIPAMAIGGFSAVDTAWQEIGTAAAAALEPPSIRLYRPGQLALLVDDLGQWQR